MRARDFEIDHFASRAANPELSLDYDNLVFACGACNGVKRTKRIPDPCKVAYGDLLKIDASGNIHAKNRDGEYLIEKMQLDDDECTRRRKMVIEQVRFAKKHIGTLEATARLIDWLGFPDDLPDLEQPPTPPGGNTRPDGVTHSYFAQRARGALADYY